MHALNAHGMPAYHCAADSGAMEAAPDAVGVLRCPTCGHQTDLPGEGKLIDAFDLTPGQWGLRGDPYVWAALRDRLGAAETPKEANDIRAMLADGVRELAWIDVDEAHEPVFREAFAHGGMSSGMVDPRFWRNTGLPLLVARAAARRPIPTPG